MRDALERWLTGAAIVLTLCAAAVRHAHRVAVRRRVRRQAGAYRW